MHHKCPTLTTFYTRCAHSLLGLHQVFPRQIPSPSLSPRSPPCPLRMDPLSIHPGFPTPYSSPLGSPAWPISNISSATKSFLIPSLFLGKNNCSLSLLQCLAQESFLSVYFNFLGFAMTDVIGRNYMDRNFSQFWVPKILDQGEDGLLFFLCPYIVVPLCVSVS